MKILETLFPYVFIFFLMVISFGTIITLVDFIGTLDGELIFGISEELIISLTALIFILSCYFLFVYYLIKYS